MTTVRIEEIKRDILRWLQRVEAGEKIVILKANKPMAEIIPLSEKSMDLRPIGLCKGEFSVPDDFDASLPEEVMQQFEGK